MKISRVMLALIAALFLSMPAWSQTSNGQQGTSATANATGQQGASASATAQENTPNPSAGQNTPAAPNGQNSSAAENSSSGATLRGCVTGGAGTYVLISDSDGAAYTLVGQGPELDKQINHEVEVTGTPVSAPPSSQSSSHNSEAGAPAHASGNNFQVTTVREITDHCPPPQRGK